MDFFASRPSRNEPPSGARYDTRRDEHRGSGIERVSVTRRADFGILTIPVSDDDRDTRTYAQEQRSSRTKDLVDLVQFMAIDTCGVVATGVTRLNSQAQSRREE